MSTFNDVMSSLFGGNSYSTTPRTLSESEIRTLISETRISSLSQKEVAIVEDALVHGRNGSMISLSKIDQILRHLEQTRQITRYDRDSVMKVFKSHMGTR